MTTVSQSATQPRDTLWLGAGLLMVLAFGAGFGTSARPHAVLSTSALALLVLGLAALTTTIKFNHLGRDRALVLYCAYVGVALVVTLIFLEVGGADAINASLALTGFAAAYATASSLCNTCRTRMLWGIAALASVLGVYGLAAHQMPELYLSEKIYNHHAVTATFINPNHLATLLGFGSVAALALLFSGPHLNTRAAIFLAICLYALLQTGSRAGLTATFLGLSSVLILHMRRRGTPISYNRVTLLVAGLISLVVILALGLASVTGERLANLAAEAPIRIALYGDVASAVAAKPLTGYGLGSFEGAFRMLQGEAVNMDRAWLSAHSAPLETLFETGVVLVLLPIAALVLCAKRVLNGVEHDTGPASIAALGILATGLSHSLFDNTLSIPAVGMTFAAGLGLARSAGAPACVWAQPWGWAWYWARASPTHS